MHTGSRRQRKGRGDRRTAELASTVRNALEETILVELFPKAQIDLGIQVLQADGSVLAACINAAMLAVADAGAPLLTSTAMALCTVTMDLQHRLLLNAALHQFCLYLHCFCSHIVDQAYQVRLGVTAKLTVSHVQLRNMSLACAGIPMRDMIAATTVGYLESTPLLDINHTERTGNGPELLLALHVNQDKAIIITEEGAVNPETLEGMAELAEQGCKAVGKFLRQSLLEHIQRHATVRGLTVK